MQAARFHLRNTALDQWPCVVNCLADLFAGDNGQFKRDRFKRACEPGAFKKEASQNSGLPVNETYEQKSEIDNGSDRLRPRIDGSTARRKAAFAPIGHSLTAQ